MKMNRVFLKLSGEALAGPKKTGFDTGGYCDWRGQFLEGTYQRGH